MEFKTCIANPRHVEAALYHIECSHFFGDEQYGFAVGDSAGNDIGDGLGLAGSGRALNDKISATARFMDSQCL